MSKIPTIAAIGILASGLGSGLAFAQKATDNSLEGVSMGDVTVSATRTKATATTVGWPQTPVKQITLSYSVNTAKYDLTTTSGAAELEKVVNATAVEVCKEIARQYPDTAPEDGGCARTAAAKAMNRVRELTATANLKARNK